MGYGRILYQNRVPSATITCTGGSVTSGYPLTNLGVWRDYYTTRTSGANSYVFKFDCGEGGLSAASLALVNHNLFTCSARFKLEHSDNDSDYTEVVGYVTPTADVTIARFFTAATKRYWRLTVDNNGGANFSLEIGVAFIGNYLEFPRLVSEPFDPDRQKLQISRATGDTGRILGTAVDYRDRPLSVTLEYCTKTWYTATFLPFWEACYDQPFVFVWDYENHAAEAYFCEWAMDDLSAPYARTFRTPLTLEMRSLVE